MTGGNKKEASPEDGEVSGCRENLDSFIFFLKVSISKFYNRDKSTKGGVFSYVPH
jgi:hypothetical protein